jgi:hypothetical protein
MVDLDKAIFIGEGEWVKDSAYQVYELEILVSISK